MFIPPDRKISVGIITYPRNPDPLPATLISAIASDDTVIPENITVFADALSANIIPQVGLIARSQEELDSFDDFNGIKYLGTNNMSRVLDWGAANGDIVVELEDDILFTRDWLKKAYGLLVAAETALNKQIVLSMHDCFLQEYFPLCYTPAGIQIDKYSLHSPKPSFTDGMGAQGHIMHSNVAVKISHKLKAMTAGLNAEQRKQVPPDYAMLRACRETEIELINVDPALLWHQENTSTWFANDAPPGMTRVTRTRNFSPT